MVAKQLSIFLENKSGRLTEVTEVLAKEGVNLSALCIAENADFGILRGIVSEPDKAYKALKDNHFAVNVTDVVGISCPNIPGSLAKVLRCLSDEGVFIEYMYSFANGQTATILGLLTYGGFVGMNRVSGTGDYTIDQYAATDDGGLLTVTKGGTALHVKCSADQLAVVETQPDGTFHLSFSYSQITNKGTLKDITPAG